MSSMMLNILGAKLAEISGKSELSCRGVVRYAVSDNVKHLQQTADYKIWREHLQTMSYVDWDRILQSPATAERLANVGIKDTPGVVKALRQTLTEKQSLLTLAAR